MSWLSIPLPNPFKSLNFSDDDKDDQNELQQTQNDAVSYGGVKDDLSAIGDSISRQFRGVASFLAPPSSAVDGGQSSSNAVDGIRSDLAEIGGSLKNTFSLFSNPNKAVSEISKLASDFLQLNEDDDENSQNFDNFDDDYDYDYDDKDKDDDYDDDDDEEEEEYGLGVTDQVIEFARSISERSELWIDFPLSLDNRDFDMSEAQSEHASIVEQMVPSLADLRNKISKDKSEQQFWMIYFILLLPRLNDDDLELLSTPQIIEARETLLMMLRMKKNEDISPENSQSLSSSALDNQVDNSELENTHSVRDVTTFEIPNSSSNIEINKSDTTDKLGEVKDATTVTSSEPSSSEAAKSHENADYLREKDETVLSGTSGTYPKRFQPEDDVSFSDLEDDDIDLPNREASSGSSQIKRNSSTEGSSDWVRLNEGTRESHVSGKSSLRNRDSEGEDSTDWLTVDDFDP